MWLKLPWETQTLDDGRIQSQADCGGYVAWVESYEKLEGAVWWAAVVYKANRMHAEEPRVAWSNHSAEPRSLAAAQEAAEAAAARLLAEDAGVRALMGVDALHAELARISTEMGMPPGVGPADGELARLMKDGNALRAELEKRREDVRLLRESLADVRERMALERVVAVESVRRELANAHAMLNEWRQLVEDARQDKADLRARVVTLEAALRWRSVGEDLPAAGQCVMVPNPMAGMNPRKEAPRYVERYYNHPHRIWLDLDGRTVPPPAHWRPLPPGPEVGQ